MTLMKRISLIFRAKAYKALDRIYQSTAQWSDLGAVIQRELVLVPPGDNAAIVELRWDADGLPYCPGP